MALAAHQVLQNRYRVVSLLKQGGMGAVYRARDIRLNVPVALKEMIPQPGLDSRILVQLRQQFQQEATVLARLDHSHLVDVTDFFEEGGNVYLVMKLIEGENLAEHIERRGALPEEEVLILADQLLDALTHCHAQGVIHRDVKPQNVIIRPDGRAVLVDFGLVKLWDPDDPHTRTAMRGMGTPEYAPPEQYEMGPGHHTGPRSDIYALGATLYHALTGHPPPTAIQRVAIRNAFRMPRVLNPRISATTEAAVLRAMELTAEDRFPTPRDMGAALRSEAPDLARPVVTKRSEETRVMLGARPTAIGRSLKRLPAWVWGSSGLLILAVVAGLTIRTITGNTAAGLASTSTPSSTSITTPRPASTAESKSTPTHAPTSPPTGTATPRPSSTPATTPTSRPTSTPAPTSTPLATATPRSTSTPAPTLTPLATATSKPTPTSARGPTSTPVLHAAPPELVAPSEGGTFSSPITFEWHGSLNADQTYQVTTYHPQSGHVIQSGLLTSPGWTTDLPSDKYGEWRWRVSVVQGGVAMTTSSDWMFWLNPGFGSGSDDRATSEPPPP